MGVVVPCTVSPPYHLCYLLMLMHVAFNSALLSATGMCGSTPCHVRWIGLPSGKIISLRLTYQSCRLACVDRAA